MNRFHGLMVLTVIFFLHTQVSYSQGAKEMIGVYTFPYFHTNWREVPPTHFSEEEGTSIMHLGGTNFFITVNSKSYKDGDVLLEYNTSTKKITRHDYSVENFLSPRLYRALIDNNKCYIASALEWASFDGQLYTLFKLSKDYKLEEICKFHSDKIFLDSDNFSIRGGISRYFIGGYFVDVHKGNAINTGSIFPGETMKSLSYDESSGVEYSAWENENLEIIFRAYSGDKYTVKSIYKNIIDKYNIFIVNSFLFIVEEIKDIRLEKMTYAYKITRVTENENVTVGYYVTQNAFNPKKIIELPDGYYALLFNLEPGILKFKPGEAIYYRWGASGELQRHGAMNDFVYADNTFYLLGSEINYYPHALLISVPESMLEKVEDE